MAHYMKFLCGLLFVAVLVSAGPVETDETVDSSGQPRFLDDLFDEINKGMDLNVGKIVNQGGSFVKKVQQIQGGGQTHIIKTEITSSSSFGGGHRFKRGIFDKITGLVDQFDDKVSKVTDKLADTISTGVNLGYEAGNRIQQRLPA